MAVPKRKLSRSRRDSRQANKFLRPAAFGLCTECATPLLPHQACMSCGYYKGRKVISTKMDRALDRTKLKSQKTADATQESTEKETKE